jgi:PKD repeat protein
MKIKNSLIAITMIVMLLLSSFAIAPAVNSTTKSNKLSKLTMQYVERSMSWYSPIYGNNIITEGFEDGIMPPPGGWYTLDGNAVEPWFIVDDLSYVHSGNYAAAINFDSLSQSDNWLVSPNINLTGYVKANLTFWAASDTMYPNATMELHIRGDGFDYIIWDMIQDENWTTFEYRELTFNLSTYLDQTINISWRYVGLDGESFLLDDILIDLTTEGPPNQPPVANFTYTINDLMVSFTSTATDPDGNIGNWTWNFDDGTPVSYESNPQHNYVDERIYNVTLTVKDNYGAPNSITKNINVINNPPVADFSSSVDGTEVFFNPTSSYDINGTIVSYKWDFGDESNVTFPNNRTVRHTFVQDYKTYHVILVVTDSGGKSDTFSQDVTINDTTMPTIKIVKPVKALYIKNKVIRQFLFRMALIIGIINIEVNVSDVNGSGINYVQLWINKDLVVNQTSGLINFTWKRDRFRLIHIFKIKVVAYDKAGNQAETKMIVRKIL